MQWFKLPPKIFFEKNSLLYLEKMENVERVMIVCDPGMVQFGYCDTVREVLARRKNDVKIEVFSDVEPNPSTYRIRRNETDGRLQARYSNRSWRRFCNGRS